MTQENKELLLKDLCARLPYGVKVTWDGLYSITLIPSIYGEVCKEDRDENIPKVYLRPMSSMTDEEMEELSDYLCERVMPDKSGITFPPDPIHGKGIPFEWMSSCIDWLNKHHFDYRGLIPMGLALEAPKDMYNI